jgi:hypothetical protein
VSIQIEKVHPDILNHVVLDPALKPFVCCRKGATSDGDFHATPVFIFYVTSEKHDLPYYTKYKANVRKKTKYDWAEGLLGQAQISSKGTELPLNST